MNETTVFEVLSTVIHPETGLNLAEGKYIDSTDILYAGNDTPDDDTPPCKIIVRLSFRKRRDPFASSLARKAREALSARFPDSEICVETVDNNAAGNTSAAGADANANAGANAGAGANANAGANNNKKKSVSQSAAGEDEPLAGGARIIAVASGKGGVGKSTVTANLAVTLRNMGFRVGILDADIYGPSQPKLFGCEGYAPEVDNSDGTERMLPAEVRGIKIMSIGFFVGSSDALLWRGPMATSALRQLTRQTLWGELDYLLCDLPPGTGDIHLSLISELHIDGAVIVSTPHAVAVADVVRGVEMLRNERVGIPVVGIIENMSWFTPAELPENRYYIFGRGGARHLAERCGVDFLGEIPLASSVGESGDGGLLPAEKYPFVEEYYRQTALKIVEKCPKKSR